MRTIVFLPCLLLASCVTKATKPELTPIERNDVADGIIRNEMADYSTVYPEDITAIKVPVLKASGYGKPSYRVMGDGSYLATYRKGTHYLRILGTSRPPATLAYPPDGHFRFMDQAVNYHTTGNEDPEYTSRLISLNAPDGRTANYAVVYGNTGGSIQVKDLEKVKFGW